MLTKWDKVNFSFDSKLNPNIESLHLMYRIQFNGVATLQRNPLSTGPTCSDCGNRGAMGVCREHYSAVCRDCVVPASACIHTLNGLLTELLLVSMHPVQLSPDHYHSWHTTQRFWHSTSILLLSSVVSFHLN